MTPIDGATRLLAIVGDPIAQARSPAILNAMLARRGRNMALVPWQAAPPDFETVMRGLQRTANLDGIILTYPHKQAALGLADDILTRARQVGAANAMRRDAEGRWIADMFDGVGLVGALAAAGVGVSGRSVMLAGAGGAGGAIAFALAAAGARSVAVTDLDAGRAAALAAAVSAAHPVCDAHPGRGGADILINATPVGLLPADALPFPLDGVGRDAAVVDIVPRAGGTQLLAQARARGCVTIEGSAMVEGQAAALLGFFGVAD